jgi:hypothetical protein
MQKAAPTRCSHAEGAVAERRSGAACGRMLRIRLDLTAARRRGPSALRRGPNPTDCALVTNIGGENKKMLCFEVWKNGTKLTVAGVRESGVVSLLLTWVGKGHGASTLAASAKGAIPGLDFRVGGIDSSDPAGDKDIEWVEGAGLRLGDDIHVRLVSAEVAAPPPRSEPLSPVSRVEAGVRVIQCSFCGQMRQNEPEPWLKPGIAGANVFICVRCLVLAERLLEDGEERLGHLTRTADKTCSFCGAEHTEESVAARQADICRACIAMVMI